jgi:uridylate kinase
MYPRLTYQKVMHDRLNVMDFSAFEMCSQVKLPILVFNYTRNGAIEDAVAGKVIGTLVTAE